MIKGLMIAIPTRDTIHIQTALSLFGIVAELVKQQIPHAVNYYGSADVAMSRNRLAAIFLNDEKFSHVLFVDSDMEFDPAIVGEMASINVPFTACAYPKRDLSLEKFRAAVEAECEKPVAERVATSALVSEVSDFTVRVTDYDGQPWRFESRDGWISMPGVGFGLALISREVFTTMIAAGCVEPHPVEGKDGERFPEATSFGYFNPIRRQEGPGWLSEDLSFCQRWVTDCGGKIWVPGNPTIKHIGNFVFAGSLAEKFRRRAKTPASGEPE